MGFRLKTSKNTMEIFEYLEARMNLQPFILSKLAISLSIKEGRDIEKIKDEDQNGLELNRQTIMGSYDEIFKCILEENLGRNISEDEYFPKYTKRHLDNGARILRNKYDYNMNAKRLFESLIKDSVGI